MFRFLSDAFTVYFRFIFIFLCACDMAFHCGQKYKGKKRHDNILFQIEKQKIMPLYGKNKSKFTKRNKKNKTILNKITRYQKLR
jgi:hypothetical protein